MKLVIKSFPPISQKCTIDLSKKVTLFVGKNNSGKTYITQLIWAINNFNESNKNFNYLELDKEPTFILTSQEEKSSFKLDENTLNIISHNFSTYLKETVVDEIFNNKMNADFDVILDINDIKEKKILDKVSGPNWDLHINKRKNSLTFNFEVVDDSKEDETLELPFDILNQYIETLIISLIINKNTVFMPSTRLFLPSFYKYIYTLDNEHKTSALKNINLVNKENKSFFESSYTIPINELIKKLIFELDSSAQNNKYLDDLSRLIEGDISVNIPEGIGMAEITYSLKDGKILPMYLSSSMVNQLSMIYLYFKYWYQKEGNFLLLDEPEMNLHPEKKIEVFEQLLDYASENKLLIATHSSSIAKSLINYMNLFDLKEKDNELEPYISENKLNMNLNINLKSNDIGIYYFNGNTVISYKDDDESNIHFGTFTDIEKLQNKQYEYILDRLEEYES